MRAVDDGLRLFVPSDETRDSWHRYCAFVQAMEREQRPEDSPKPAAITEANLRREEPDTVRRLFVRDLDGTVTGELMLSFSRPESPEYPTNKHLLWAQGHLLPECRRHGIGHSWLPRVGETMDELGATVCTSFAELESGQAFLAWIGSRKVLSGTENRLELRSVDWAMVDRWSRIDSGFRLQLHEPRVPEPLFGEFCPAYTQLGKGVPLEQMDEGDWITTPERMRDNYARMDAEGSAHLCLLAYDSEGIVGLTEFVARPYEPELIRQELTAVLPRAQGHGLGKLLKAVLLLHVRKHHPQARWVVTENANSNAPMLSINERLGFRPYRAGGVYQITRDELNAAV